VPGSATSDDYANVVIRTPSGTGFVRVFHGPGDWDYQNDKAFAPQVRWLDNNRLFILYHREPVTRQASIGDVQVICVQGQLRTGGRP
jgi:hypothetical protein